MTDTSVVEALVLVSYGGQGVVMLPGGRRQRCKFRRQVGRPYCGDRVMVARADDESLVVEHGNYDFSGGSLFAEDLSLVPRLPSLFWQAQVRPRQIRQKGGYVELQNQLSVQDGQYLLQDGWLRAERVRLVDNAAEFLLNGGNLTVHDEVILDDGLLQIRGGDLEAHRLVLGDPTSDMGTFALLRRRAPRVCGSTSRPARADP